MSLVVSHWPHLRSKVTTPYIMVQVVVALLPATAAAVMLFKLRAAFLILNCVLTAVASEAVICRLRRQPSTLKDFSAVVTGLLLALILPPATAWYAATLGAVFAVVVGKHLFGGLGANIFNPALIGRAFLVAAYPKMLTTYIKPFSVEAISCATPLALQKFDKVATPLSDLFLGQVGGTIGETSALCLIIGGLYLLLRRIADWRVPVSLLATTATLAAVFFFVDPAHGTPLFHLFGGGLLLGAFFMATDPVTTPVTKKGRYIFGLGCGLLIMVLRIFGGSAEGVMYSILFMNVLTPLLNRYTKPRRFGG